jgi:hypothetical protein
VEKFREAMTSPIVDALTRSVNANLDEAERAHDECAHALKTEILRMEREAGNLVRFLAGGESFSVRIELQSIETALQGLRVELAKLEQRVGLSLPRVAPGWIRAQLEHLDGLLRDDAQRARLEILKHLDGDLTIRALPSARKTGHAFEITGRLKVDGLLAMNQEAGCGRLVAGAGFEPATFGL